MYIYASTMEIRLPSGYIITRGIIEPLSQQKLIYHNQYTSEWFSYWSNVPPAYRLFVQQFIQTHTDEDI